MPTLSLTVSSYKADGGFQILPDAERTALENAAYGKLDTALSAWGKALLSGATADTINVILARLDNPAWKGNIKMRDALIATLRAAADVGVEYGAGQIESVVYAAPAVKFTIPNLDDIVDWTMAHAEAAKWSITYGYQLIRGITATTRQLVATEVEYFVNNSLTINEMRDRLVSQTGGAFSQARARRIAVTEVTRAYAEGNMAAWRTSGVVRGKEWYTSVDALVCFPAYTPVATATGSVSIQNIRPGDMVHTRKGLRRVLAVRQKSYAGPMTYLRAGWRFIIATSDHPVWHLEKGWLHAGKFKTGDGIETFGNQAAKIGGVINFSLGQSQNTPSVPGKIAILTGITGGVLMPIAPVSFDSNEVARYSKVNAVAANSSLLHKINTKRFKFVPDPLFEQCLASETAIASKAAELAVGVSGLHPKPSATVATFNHNCRAAAFFRTVLAGAPSFAGERLATRFTRFKGRANKSAFYTANGVSIGVAFCDGETIPTPSANLRDVGAGAATSPATKLAAPVQLWASNRFTALLAKGDRQRAKGVVTAPRAELVSRFGIVGAAKRFAAMSARAFHNCTLLLLTVLNVLYHRLYDTPITVYDIQVEGEPEFYAGGILVHNCKICAPLHGVVVPIDQPFPGGIDKPPAHVSCRCDILPVVIGDTGADLTQWKPVEQTPGIFDWVQVQK